MPTTRQAHRACQAVRVFDGFADERLDLGPVVLRVRRSPTTGPAVLLLHGHPRTAATWHAVARCSHQAGTPWSAPTCAATAGPPSRRPPPTTPRTRSARWPATCSPSCAASGTSASPWSGTTGAATSRCASRSTTRRGVRARRARQRAHRRSPRPLHDRFATAWWHWFFFAQPDKPERAILADPDAWYGGSPSNGRRRVRGVPRGPSTTRRPCARCSRTTAPGLGLDRATTRPIGPPVGASRARCWSCGRATTTSKALRGSAPRSGADGPRTCGAGTASSPGTTWPRKRPSEVAAVAARRSSGPRRTTSDDRSRWRVVDEVLRRGDGVAHDTAQAALAVGVPLVVRARPATAQVVPEARRTATRSPASVSAGATWSMSASTTTPAGAGRQSCGRSRVSSMPDRPARHEASRSISMRTGGDRPPKPIRAPRSPRGRG